MKLLPCLSLLLFALVPTIVNAQHPLDALSADEITKTTDILKNAGLVDEQTLVALITLLEPPRDSHIRERQKPF
jgi:Cu2+-containing amine oxidase